MTDPGPGGRPSNNLYQKETRYGRRMTLVRRWLYSLATPLALGILRFWWRTCRIVQVDGAEHLDAALAKYPSLIPCYWHQHTLFCGRYLLDQKPRGLKVGWLISPSVDGEIGVIIVNQLGGDVIRGSSTHTGARALRDYYQGLMKENLSPIITPDGPRGPRFKFKPGAILLAQMSGRPILLLAYAASHAWMIKWDKFVIPWPFARISIAIGAPRSVPRVLDGSGLERLQGEMEAELKSLFQRARALLQERSS
jgi:lysophospholipid acyltransferase (LPLAT)-like uncharacterized protein